MATTPIRMTVAFDEADGEGIVFFGNYFRMAHRALEQFLPQLQVPWPEWFANPEWGAPLRHVEADYLQPLRPGDVCDVLVSVEEVGESSVTFAYEFRAAEGKVVARLKTSHVLVTRGTFKKKTIPDSVRARLTGLQG